MTQVAILSGEVTADTAAAEKNLGGVQNSLHKTGAAFDQTGARANRMRLITLQVADTQAKLSAETDELRRAMLKVKLDDLTQQYRGLAAAQDGAATKTQSFGEKLMAAKGTIMMATAAVAAVGVAIKKAFDYAAAGAAIEQTVLSFDRLGVSIESLREAAGGTMSDMELMAATNKLLAGTTGELNAALQASAPHLLATARAAVKLDPTIGSVAFVYESLARGIKKNQPLLIDNANLIVSAGKANERWAASHDTVVKSMSAEQKQMALLDDTLRAGDVMLAQVGGTTESLVDPFSRLSAATKNYTNDLKRGFSPALAGAANAIADLFDTMRDAEAVNREWHQSGGLVSDLASNMAIKFEVLREILGGNNTALDRYNQRLAENAAANDLSTGQMADYAAMAQETSGEVDGLSLSTEGLTEATAASRESLKELHDLMKGALGEQLDSFADKQTVNRQKTADLTAEIDILNGKDYLTAAQQEELDGLQEELRETRQRAEDNAATHEEATRRILFGYMEQRLAMDGLTTAELNALQKVANQWGLTDDATYKAIGAIDAAATSVENGYSSWDGFISRAERLDSALRGLPTSHDFTVNYYDQYRGNTGQGTPGAPTMPSIRQDTPGGPAPSSGAPPPSAPPPPTGGGGIQMATGFEGVFNRPTHALFGEAGPEYVLAMPLEKMQQGGGGNAPPAPQYTINMQPTEYRRVGLTMNDDIRYAAMILGAA